MDEKLNQVRLNLASKKLREMRENRILTDVVLKCRGGTIQAHRCVLMATNPFFYNIFSDNLNGDAGIQIEFEHCNVDVMVIVISTLYGDVPQTFKSLEQIINVLETSHLIEEMMLFNYCMNLLIQLLTVDNCIEIWTLTVKYGQKKAEVSVKKFMVEHLATLLQSGKLADMTVDQMTDFVSFASDSVTVGDQLISVVMQWGKKNQIQRLDKVITLFNLLEKLVFSTDRVHALNDDCLIKSSPELMAYLTSAKTAHNAPEEAQATNEATFSVSCTDEITPAPFPEQPMPMPRVYAGSPSSPRIGNHGAPKTRSPSTIASNGSSRVSPSVLRSARNGGTRKPKVHSRTIRPSVSSYDRVVSELQDRPIPIVRAVTPCSCSCSCTSGRPTTPVTRSKTPIIRPKTPKNASSRPTTPNSRPTPPSSRPTPPSSRPTTPNSRPTTPNSRPTTPVSRPPTPISRPPTPNGRPTTPVGRPTTPNGRSTTPEAQERSKANSCPKIITTRPKTPNLRPKTPIIRAKTPKPILESVTCLPLPKSLPSQTSISCRPKTPIPHPTMRPKTPAACLSKTSIKRPKTATGRLTSPTAIIHDHTDDCLTFRLPQAIKIINKGRFSPATSAVPVSPAVSIRSGRLSSSTISIPSARASSSNTSADQNFIMYFDPKSNFLRKPPTLNTKVPSANAAKEFGESTTDPPFAGKANAQTTGVNLCSLTPSHLTSNISRSNSTSTTTFLTSRASGTALPQGLTMPDIAASTPATSEISIATTSIPESKKEILIRFYGSHNLELQTQTYSTLKKQWTSLKAISLSESVASNWYPLNSIYGEPFYFAISSEKKFVGYSEITGQTYVGPAVKFQSRVACVVDGPLIYVWNYESIAQFDTESYTWKALAPNPHVFAGWSNLLATSGQLFFHATFPPAIYKYDFQKNEWELKKAFKETSNTKSIKCKCFQNSCKKKLYFIANERQLLTFDTETNAWSGKFLPEFESRVPMLMNCDESFILFADKRNKYQYFIYYPECNKLEEFENKDIMFNENFVTCDVTV